MALLDVARLTKSFGGFRAVQDVSFAVAPGEFSAVIGPNGAGKTTLFNLLTGHLPKSAGRVVFDGADITDRSRHDIVRLGIARAFQRANVFPAMTVLENVHVAVLVHRHGHRHLVRPARADREGRARAREILAAVHLEPSADVPAGSLSHGDQKLLDIALALASDPKILLLDEPTAGMHPERRRDTMALIRELWRDLAMTVLFIEHDMDIVFEIAGLIRVLHQGRLIAEGPPAEIRENRFVVEAYLGEAVL
jgi:branched-chain amino acid transport system ATP-binding protein